MFVVTGVINLVYCLKNKVNTRYPVWMVVALVTAMLGDVLLGINFYLGAAFLPWDTSFYFLSYCTLIRFNRRDLLLSVCIFLISLGILLFVPVLRFDSALMQGVCIAYAFGHFCLWWVRRYPISLGKGTPFTILVAVGSFFLLFSDFYVGAGPVRRGGEHGLLVPEHLLPRPVPAGLFPFLFTPGLKAGPAGK